jgi:hypothetical protein
MRLAMSFAAAAILVPSVAVAQSGSTDTTRTTSTSSSTSTSTRASARADLAIPLAGGANTGLGYSYNRTSRVVERDLASRGIARAIEGDLAALRNAQDVYFAQHATYATSIDKLPGFRVTSGAVINLRDVTDMGWTAEATHPSLPKSSFLAQVNRAEIVTSPAGP